MRWRRVLGWTTAETSTVGGGSARGGRGPPSTLEAIYQAHYTRLVALSRTILARTDGAEEIVQEAFVRTLAP